MRPAPFAEQNVVFGSAQPEYDPLPAHASMEVDGIVTTCWELSEIEIAAIVKHKRIWTQQMTFGKSLQPQRVTVTKPTLT